ncbi:homeobox protein extradenticle [Anaeramoeba ignava]|uniref:Homeobox protein extradenticle n=1 Tax=Anaeramoeba ignava TaxID=1746090 RepID=A0A9Q0R505_ANAIG|nr:homeobox protein extradenticle [Anaeramoeba ignava]
MKNSGISFISEILKDIQQIHLEKNENEKEKEKEKEKVEQKSSFQKSIEKLDKAIEDYNKTTSNRLKKLKTKYKRETKNIEKSKEKWIRKLTKLIKIEDPKSFKTFFERMNLKFERLQERLDNNVIVMMERLTCNEKKRKKADKNSQQILENWFRSHINTQNGPYLTKEQKVKLAKQCKMTEEQIATWFGNRRRKFKDLVIEGKEKKPIWLN